MKYCRNTYHPRTVFQKNAIMTSTISWTIIFHLQRFLAHLLLIL